MKLKALQQSQRDNRWGSILLGYNTQSVYNIYNYGCLITSFGNYIGKQPDEVNQILKDNGGFTAGGGDFYWSKSVALGITQTYISPYYNDAVTTQGITKIKEFISQGIPLVCEVDFNPADTVKQQHFVLLAGIDDVGNILVVDPWEGQWETWGEEAVKRNVYQFRAYDKTLPKDDGTSTVAVDSKVFENLVRKSTVYDKIILKLNIQDNETVVLSEIDKFIKYDDALMIKDRQVQEAQTQIGELKTEITKLQEVNATEAAEASTLTEKVSELEQKYIQSTQNYENALGKIKELETAIMAPVRRGWKAFLVALVDRL